MAAGPSPTDAQRRRTVAVTGAGGFIGRALVARLRAEGHRVLALSRSAAGPSPAADQRVPDYGDVERLAADLAGAELVLHLAARAHQAGEEDRSHEALYREANVDTTLNVARASRRAGAARVVFVSSIGVNGNRTGAQPFRPGDLPRPVEAYAASKWAAEQALSAELAAGPTDFVIVRPPLVYGPGCPGNFARLIHLVQKAPVVPLGGLHAPRSLIYVGNLVDALWTAAIHPAASRRTFLLSDGRDMSVAEVAATLAPALGRSRACVWNVPETALKWIAAISGRQAAYRKLADPLQVDSREFSAATGWRAPVDPHEGLRLTARDALQSAQRLQ